MESLWCAGLACVGVLCAGGAGINIWTAFDAWHMRDRYRARMRGSVDDQFQEAKRSWSQIDTSAFENWVIQSIIRTSRMVSLGHSVRFVPQRLVNEKWIDAHSQVAGLASLVTPEGFYETKLRMAFVGGVLGALIGMVFSVELSVILLAVGAFFGWRLPTQVIVRRIHRRAQEMERHLPEMLDVIALGMRSGLSFDRSLSLYIQHFDTLASYSFDLAQKQWICGLVTRDEALHQVAASYDSAIFTRVIESIVRSLRFGSSMVEGLEAASVEARTNYRTTKQEQVAKAPVRMMIPTGVLILPAMLILVLGPVLLELVGSF